LIKSFLYSIFNFIFYFIVKITVLWYNEKNALKGTKK